MDAIITVSVLSAIVGIGFAIFFANKFAEIADMKGHDGGAYFWYVLLFGLIGMVMVAALPDKNQKADSQHRVYKSVSVDKGSVTEVKYLECANCRKKITHYPCEHCGHTIEEKDAPYWCGKCGCLGPFADKCPQCGSGIKFYGIKQK